MRGSGAVQLIAASAARMVTTLRTRGHAKDCPRARATVGQNIAVPTVVNLGAMKRISTGLLLAALSVAACGTTYAPAVEEGAPAIRTAVPLVAPSPAASPSDAAPVNATPASANTLQTRPMGDNEATTAPAQNAPAPAGPLSGDRCNGPTPDPKVPPPACPPQ